MVRAAVFREPGAPMQLGEIELAPTGPTQVRIRMLATGVCHSDLSLLDGDLPYMTPAVLGHEGCGVVTEVGADVATVTPGDRVLIAWNQPCRECRFCTAGEVHLCERAMADSLSVPFAEVDGEAVAPLQGAGTFTEETLVLERAVVPLEVDLPPEEAALIGCAVATGAGAALRTADVPEGGSVAVIGCGGVGLSAVQGARIAGAARVVAVDVVPAKLDRAQRLGATDGVDASVGDPVEAIMELTDGHGVDVAIEALGRVDTIRQAYDCTRRGGQTIVVGAGSAEEQVGFTPLELFYSARSLIGCVYGSTDPQRDFPRFADLARAGELDLAGLITHRTGLEGLQAAFDRMRRGEGVRSVVLFDGPDA